MSSHVVLPLVLVVLLQGQSALGMEGSLAISPFEPTSTLGSHVPKQNLDLQETVLDFVNSGILIGKPQKPKPQFQAPKLVSPENQRQGQPANQAVTPTEPTLAAPTLAGPENVQPQDDESEVAESSPQKPLSPFRKWVKPQTESVEEAEEPEAAAVPQLARRSGSAEHFANAKPIPKAEDQDDTAFISDLSKHDSDESVQEEVSEQLALPAKPKTAETLDTDPSTYPEPDEEAKAEPARRLPPLTSSQIALRNKVRGVLKHYYNRPLNTRDRSPWEIMHAMLAFEAQSKVLQGGPDGKPITAVGWLCYNQDCKRRSLMYVDEDNELHVRVGPALQGHRGQLLAMLAQSRINKNYPMLVEGHELKITDLIEMEKRTCYPRTELTFKLIGLMHYLDSDETWMNDQGMQWDIPKLISEELKQPVRGAACGGTHRLSGLTLAYKTREKRGEPLDGEFLKAKQFVTRYQQYAYRMQNQDGSFSTEWFRGPGNEQDIERKLKTTGHILEWLLYAATDKELNHWRTTKAVNFLANLMSRNRYKDWDSGIMCHGIHALLVYDRLMFGPYDSDEQLPVAERSSQQRTQRRSR